MLNKHGRILLAILMLAITVIVIWLFPAPGYGKSLTDEPTVWPAQSLVTAEHITDYIRDWLQAACYKRKDAPGRNACLRVTERQKRWKRAPKLAKMIDQVADERDQDPYVVAVIVAHESSFQEGNLQGAIGERGLMQLHGWALSNAEKAGYDLNTSLGQLQGGADHLVRCFESCDGALLQTLSRYQTGQCSTRAYGPRLRAKRVREVRSRFATVSSMPGSAILM